MNGIFSTNGSILPDHPIAMEVHDSGQNTVSEQTLHGSTGDIVTFLRSANYPEFEHQFREDLAMVRQACSDACEYEYLDWFEEMIFEYRWPLKEKLSFVYHDLRCEVGEFARCFRDFEKREKSFYDILPPRDRIINKVRSFDCSSTGLRQVLANTLAYCEEAVSWAVQTDSARSVKDRLFEKLSGDTDSLKFSQFTSLPATNEWIYSILDDFYFWVEAGNGRCRQPALNDLLSINFANCSAKTFRALAKQAIAHTTTEEGAVVLLQFLEHTWRINGHRYDLLTDAAFVCALKNQLEQTPALRAGLIQAIKGKQQAVTADLTRWCQEPGVIQAYLVNQMAYTRRLCFWVKKPSVKDKLLALPADMLKQLKPEFYTHHLGKHDRQALIRHHLGGNKYADPELSVQIMEFGMEGDAELISPQGLNVLASVANPTRYQLLPRLQKLEGINPNLEGKSDCFFAGLTALTLFIENYSRRKADPEIMHQLLTYPNMDVNHQNTEGLTPLMFAVKQGISEPTDILLSLPEIQAKINLKDHKGNTALMHASKTSSGIPAFPVNRLKSLVQTKGIDFNGQNIDGRTALMLASEEGFSSRLKILLSQNGIDKNAQDKDNNTALMLTIINKKHDWMQCAQLLIESGVDLTCRNKAGLDAYQLAHKHCGGEDNQLPTLLEQALNSRKRLADTLVDHAQKRMKTAKKYR